MDLLTFSYKRGGGLKNFLPWVFFKQCEFGNWIWNSKFWYGPLYISDSEILRADGKSRLLWSYPLTKTSWITFKQIIEMHWFGARSSQLCKSRFWPKSGLTLWLIASQWSRDTSTLPLFDQYQLWKAKKSCKPFLSNIDQSLKARFLTPSMTSAKMASSLAILTMTLVSLVHFNLKSSKFIEPSYEPC